MNYILDVPCGNAWQGTVEKAKRIAAEQDTIVEFEFCDTIHLVDKDTNLKALKRDYHNFHLLEKLGWKNIGPVCAEEYDEQTIMLLREYVVPTSIIPKEEWLERRYYSLCYAIDDCAKVQIPVNPDWIKERDELKEIIDPSDGIFDNGVKVTEEELPAFIKKFSDALLACANCNSKEEL